MIITKGYGWEGMSEDSIGVAFEISNELVITMQVVDIDNDVAIDVSDDVIQVSIDAINILVDVGE